MNNAKYTGNALESGDLHITDDEFYICIGYTLNDDLTIRKLNASDLTVFNNENPVWYDVDDAVRYGVM